MLNLKIFGSPGWANRRAAGRADWPPHGDEADPVASQILADPGPARPIPNALATVNQRTGSPSGSVSSDTGEAPGSGPLSALDDFIYLISHDLRASMRALLEIPVWIKEDLEAAGTRLPPVVEEHMLLLDRHTSRLDRMLFDLLAYSRVGRLQPVLPVDIGAILDQVIDATKLPDGWTLIRKLDPVQPTLGEKDALTLFQALLSNCVKHHDRLAGQIVVRTVVEGEQFVLSVADDGPGIPMEHSETVFDIMRTLRPRDQVEGSGIGLALVRKIAAIHGGSVELRGAHPGQGAADVDSASATPARGTTIEFRVPLRPTASGTLRSGGDGT